MSLKGKIFLKQMILKVAKRELFFVEIPIGKLLYNRSMAYLLLCWHPGG